jgi:hypothetical protein|tara:strand:- start:15 stop:200 length:186 start_codon:yes stop_codon:yes gene_type:complete
VSRKLETPAVLLHHWRWLVANGYKKEAASCKRQAASLTRKNYNVIVSYKLKEKDLCKQKKL